MDRYLLSGSLFLLALEVCVLLSDFGVIDLHHFENKSSKEKLVGFLDQTHEDVRRKAMASPFWENSQTQDPLYSFDSVLTLKNSSAHIELINHTHLEIFENTLVVIEPIENDPQKRMRLHLRDGHIRSQSKEDLSLISQNWSLDVSAESDLSLRLLTDHQLQVDLNKGKVVLQNNLNKQKMQILPGERLRLKDDQLSEKLSTSSELHWQKLTHDRIYAHEFPVKYNLQWEGEVHSIQMLSHQQEQQLKPELNANEMTIDLPLGHFSFYLLNEQNISQELTVEIQQAPEIRHFYPLPRDRFQKDENIDFSWLHIDQAKSYELEFQNVQNNSDQVISEKTIDRTLKTKIPGEGALTWQVIGIDDLGFKFRSKFSYPIYSLEDPLDAPIVKLPARAPASKPAEKDPGKPAKEPPPKSSYLEKIFQLIFPFAAAEEVALENVREVDLEWEAIPAADYYMIEISKDANFEETLINQRVYQNSFTWTEKRQQEKYYFRIAGGTKEGRMGKFSTPQMIDMHNLVQVATPVEPTLDQLKNIPPIAETPQEKPAIEKASTKTQAKKLLVYPVPHFETLDAAELIWNDPINSPEADSRSQFWIGATYGIEHLEKKSSSHTKDFKAELKGAHRLSMGAFAESDRNYFDVAITSSKWKNDKEENAFQKDLSTVDAEASYFHHFSPHWYYGVNLQKYTTLRRTENEEVKTDDNLLYGFGAMYLKPWPKWNYKFVGQLNFNNQYAGVLVRNEIQRAFTWADCPLAVGLRVDFQIYSGSKEKYDSSYANLFLGLTW